LSFNTEIFSAIFLLFSSMDENRSISETCGIDDDLTKIWVQDSKIVNSSESEAYTGTSNKMKASNEPVT